MTKEINARIESKLEVKTYIQNLKFSLNNGAQINFQAKRVVDEKRNEKYTNQYTVSKLFPDENPVDAVNYSATSNRASCFNHHCYTNTKTVPA